MISMDIFMKKKIKKIIIDIIKNIKEKIINIIISTNKYKYIIIKYKLNIFLLL